MSDSSSTLATTDRQTDCLIRPHPILRFHLSSLSFQRPVPYRRRTRRLACPISARYCLLAVMHSICRSPPLHLSRTPPATIAASQHSNDCLRPLSYSMSSRDQCYCCSFHPSIHPFILLNESLCALYYVCTAICRFFPSSLPREDYVSPLRHHHRRIPRRRRSGQHPVRQPKQEAHAKNNHQALRRQQRWAAGSEWRERVVVCVLCCICKRVAV